MTMKKIISTCLLTSAILLNAQEKPKYPDVTANTKRVDLILPKIENDKDYKVEIRFGLELNISECEDPKDFSFNKQNLKHEYGMPNYRYEYYSVTENTPVDIFSINTASNCDSNKKVLRKVLSAQNVFMEYNVTAVPFFIPKNWTVEYRLWKVDGDFKTMK